MNKVKSDVECDLNLTKKIEIVDHAAHTYIFEADKKEVDAGIRKTNNKYTVINAKMRTSSFTCKKLKDLVDEFHDLEEQQRSIQGELVHKVLEIVSTYYPLLEKVNGIISYLDVLASFASISI